MGRDGMLVIRRLKGGGKEEEFPRDDDGGPEGAEASTISLGCIEPREVTRQSRKLCIGRDGTSHSTRNTSGENSRCIMMPLPSLPMISCSAGKNGLFCTYYPRTYIPTSLYLFLVCEFICTTVENTSQEFISVFVCLLGDRRKGVSDRVKESRDGIL